jgi:hypothetical protein
VQDTDQTLRRSHRVNLNERLNRVTHPDRLGRRDTAQLQLQRADATSLAPAYGSKARRPAPSTARDQAVRVNAKPRQLRVNEPGDGRGHHFVARLRD